MNEVEMAELGRGRVGDARNRRRKKALAAFVALCLVLFAGVLAASAQSGPSFKFGNVSTVEPDSILLDGKNWSTAKANVEAHPDGGLVAIPGSARANASFTLTETAVAVDDATTTIVFRGKSSDRLSVFAGPGGETDVLVILSWDGPSDTAPDIGVTFNNRTASLGSALGLDPDSFLGALPMPSFATTFGRTNGDPNGSGHFSRSSNLPTAATDYYADIYGSSPGQIAPLKNVGNGLQATATIDVDALGSAAGDVFPYAPGSPLVLEGSLGIGLDDNFDLAVSGWDISATLPAQDLPDIFPSFLELADSSQRWKLGLGYDTATQLTKLSATVNAKTDLFGATTNFALTATIGAGSGPASGGGGGTTTTTSPSSTTTTAQASTTTTVGGSTTTVGGSTTTVGGSTTTVGGSTTTVGGSTTTVGGSTTTVGGSTTTVGGSTTTIGGSTTTIPGSSTTIPPVFDPRLVEVSLSASFSTDWTPPAGFDFIQLTNLKVEGKFAEQRNAAGQISTKFSGGLKGQALIGGKVFKLTTSGELKRANGATQASGKIRLDFDDEISTGEILEAIGVDTGSIPSVVTDPSVGPVSLEVGYKDGTSELILTGEMSAYKLPTGAEIAARLLLRLDTDGEFMFGLRPASDPALKLSALLPAGMTVPEQIDFILADNDSGFGFVLASSAFSKSTAEMSPLVAEFFRPLEGKAINDSTPFNVEIPGPSLTVMASFKMPEQMTNLVETLGVQPRVFARGSLPLDPTGTLSLKVGLRARGDILPDWISKTELSFALSASAAPAEVSIGVEGSIDFRFRSGLPPDVVAALGGTVPVTASVPVPEGSPCPNGTVATKSGTNLADVRAYCYDELRLTVGADVVLAAAPPSVKLELRGSLQTVNPNAIWNPFGLEWIALDNAQLVVDIGVTESGVTVGLGAEGTVLVGGRDLTAALSADVSVIPGSPPSVSVKLRAIRIASGSGLSMSDMMTFANTVAGQELVDPANLGVPNFALRGVDLSFSPLGDAALCVPQGIVMAADLYVNPRNNPPVQDFSCNNGVRVPTDDAATCGANFNKGCVMGGEFQISLTGIKGQADLASLEFGPIHIGVAPPGSGRADPGGLRADFALTLGQQKLVISGGGYFDNLADPNGGALFEGQVFVSLKPTTVQVYGQAKIFGRGAMFDSTASIDILSGGSPELSIYVLMAVDGDQVGQPAWSQLVLGQTEEPLQIIADVATVAGYLLDELDRTGDPIHVLAVAPGAADASNVDLPDWVDIFNDKYLSSGVQDMADALGVGRDAIADIALNGAPSFDFPGVPSEEIEVEICSGPLDLGCYTISECGGISVDGDCWLVPPYTVPGVSGICGQLPAAARNQNGDCTAPLLVSAVLIPVFEDAIDAVIDPFVDDAIDFEIRHLAEISEGILNGSIPLLELDCAEFDFELSSGRQEVRLAMQATVLARAFGFETGFDFGDPQGSAAALLPDLVTSWLDPSNISCGEPRSDEFNELVENGVDPSDRPYLTAQIRTDDNLVIEGNALSGTVVANRAIDSTWQAELVAKTADGVVVPAMSETITFAPGVTERRFSSIVTDDFAIGTARDALTLELTAIGVPAEDLPTDLCCDLDAVSVTLVNSPPKIEDVSVSGDLDEGSPVTVSWTIDDPGEEANFPITIDWGDGDVFSPTFGSSTEVSIPHVYADDGSYVVTITQYDDDTGRDVSSLVIDIANVAPVVANLGPIGLEGDVTKIAVRPLDPGVFDSQTITIDFGDGSPTAEYYWEPSFGPSLVVDHIYADRPGVSPRIFDRPTDIYDITVTSTDNGGLSSEPTQGEAQIINQAPVIEDLELKIDAGQFGTATGRVFDPGINDTHRVFVSFLDGEDPLQEIVPEPDGTFTATFQYPEPDEVAVAAYAVDDDGTEGVIFLDEDTGDGEGDVAVEIQPRPSAVFDTGDRDVTFTATITNIGFSRIAVRSIIDDVYGEQCPEDVVGFGLQLEAGESFDCVYVGAVDGDVGEVKSNTVTVSALANSPILKVATATAEVAIVADGTETADVELELEADADSVIPPGRLVTYTATVENVGSGPFTIDAISDAQLGDVCEAVVGTEVGAGQSVTCNFEAGVGGAVGAVTTRTVTVEASNAVGSDSAVAEASVEVVGAPDVPELLVFAVPHPRTVLSGEEVRYNVSIRNVGPSSFTIDSIEESVGAECTEMIGRTLEPQEILGCGINEAVFGDVGETVSRPVTVTVSNALGTDTQTAEGRVQIGAGPSITLDPVETGEVNRPTTVSGSFDGNLGNLPQLNINWGDGGSNQFVGSGNINDDGTFSIDHTYTEAGTFEIFVILDDRDNLRAEQRTTVLIRTANTLPVLTVDPLDTAIAGVGVDLIGNFTDANTDDTHTATVDWGDGSPIDDAIVAEVDGSGSIVAQHTYTEVGDYEVTVAVVDDRGFRVTDTQTVTVGQGTATIGGAVLRTDDSGVADVKIDRFEANADGSRGTFLGTTRTDAEGRYEFTVTAGCNVLTFIAPDGDSFGGSRWHQPRICVEVGDEVTDLDAVLDGAANSILGGLVTFGDGSPVPNVKVDLFKQAVGGGRGQFAGFMRTGADGRYSFEVDADCYVLTFIAPDGESFNGSRWFQPATCVAAGEVVDDLDAVLDAMADTSLGGTITRSDGLPAEGVKVTFFATGGDGSRGTFLGRDFSGPTGAFSFQASAGCYWLVYVAPDGGTFTNGSGFLEVFQCVDTGDVVSDLDAVLEL